MALINAWASKHSPPNFAYLIGEKHNDELLYDVNMCESSRTWSEYLEAIGQNNKLSGVPITV